MKPAAILSAVLLCLAYAAPVHAVQCDVPSGSYATIQLAVDDAACTEIVLAAGFFPSAIVDRDVTIRGLGRLTSVIQGTVTVNNNAVLSLRTLGVQSGGLGGVLLDSTFAELDGEDIEITSNSGSGIDHGPTASDAVVNLRNCSISLNQRGILARIIHMDGCDVSSNTPLGGIQVGVGGTITNSTISANENTGGTTDGGGILFDGPGGTSLTIEDSTISGNFANNPNPATNTADGGGIMVRKGFLFLRRSSVVGNVTGRFGGGLALSDVFGGVATIEDSVISGNTAYGAGGGVGVLDRVEVTRSLIEGNKAWLDTGINSNGLAAGGGFYVKEDSLTLTDSTVRDNKAETAPGEGPASTRSGGGLYINTNQPVVIERSTINGNFAQVDGGGLFVNSTTNITNTTIAANRADRDGGGVFGLFPASLLHATVVENIADDDDTGDGDGGGLFGNVNVNHSLIGHNVDKSLAPQHPDCSGAGLSSGYSFLRIGDGCAAFDSGPGNQVGTIATPFNLKLVLPLSNNGGPTQTVALAASSPARDGGAVGCEITTNQDQRNYSRLAQDGNGDFGVDGDPCDIGALEAFSGCQAAPLVITNITYSDTQTIQSETTLTTVGSVVVDVTADIDFHAGTTISFGNGFQVANGGQFTAIIGAFGCT